MKPTKEIISKFSNLKSYQQKRIIKFLNNFQSINLIDSDFISGKDLVCSVCGGSRFVKNGRYTRLIDQKEIQRYLCVKCRTPQFNDKNTPLYNLKEKGKWVDFVYLMLDKEDPMSAISISKKLEISESTAFRWRHRFLSSLNQVNPLPVAEELEVDEVYFPFNVKGTLGKEKFDEYFGPDHQDNIESELREKETFMQEENYQVIFLCLHNRLGDFDFSPIKIQKKGIVGKADLERVMKDLDLSNKTVLTDKEPSMIAYMKSVKGVNHMTFKSSDMKKGILEDVNVHNNNINSMMAQLGTWFKNFHGVSTKYLENYLKWFRFINLFKLMKINEMVEYSLLDKESYPRFKNLFKTYEEFVYI